MEIEVKARLRDRDAAVQKLSALGCKFSEAKVQDDMVWVEKAGSFEEYYANKFYLRIRVQDGKDGKKVFMTAKRPKGNFGNESLVKREHEVVIDSAEEGRNMLDLMGLQEAVHTKKSRRTATCNGYEICIDEVDGLGSFVELEKMADEGAAAEIQIEMMAFLAALGIRPEDQVKKGYDILMLEKKFGPVEVIVK